MAKKIKDADGNVYVQKKPFYKKWWFIALVVLGVFGSLFGGNDNSNSKKSATKTAVVSDGVQSNEDTDEASSFYQIGDSITFDKEATITVTSVAYTEERNEFADVEANKVLVVTYNVDNHKDTDYVIGGEINLYVNGKKANSYPVAVILETISANRSFEGATQAFAIVEDGELELEIKPSLSFTAKEIVMPITVE